MAPLAKLPLEVSVKGDPADLDHLHQQILAPALGLVPQAQVAQAAPAAPVFEPAQRSTLGKIGHALGVVGEVAGTAFAPHLMPWVPGTPQYKEREQALQDAEQTAEANRALTGARADEAEALAWKATHPEAKVETPKPTAAETADQERQGREAYHQKTDPENQMYSAKDWADYVGTGRFPTASKTPAPLHDAFHEWLNDPQKYTEFMKAMQEAKAGQKGAYGQFGPAFLAYHLINQAYGKNPALLPILAPMIAKMFEAGGEPLAPGAIATISEPPVGQPLSPATGQPIGTQMPGAPTGTTRSRAQFALGGVLQEIPKIESQIRSLSDELGPVQGRWNEFMAGKVGADNPRFSGLRASLQNIATAWMRLHANSDKARQQFEELLGRSKTSGDLIANLNAIRQQAENYYLQELGYGERKQPGAAKAPAKPTNEELMERLVNKYAKGK